MMKLKKLTVWALGAILAVSLIGCGYSPSTAEEKAYDKVINK